MILNKKEMPMDVIDKSITIGAVDLFCGIGGLSYGLNQSGINVVAGIDLDPSCEYAYEKNIGIGKFIKKSIIDVTGSEIMSKLEDFSIAVLVGCAPCQPFSSHTNKIKEKEKSDKWNLLNQFLRIVKESNPDIISMENVPNLAKKEIFINFVSSLRSMEYKVSYSNVYCPDYGIPQKRRRLVLLASKLGEISIIQNTHNKENYLTVRDAIGVMEHLDNGQKSKTDKLHYTTRLSKNNLTRIRASKPNGTWEDWPEELRLACHQKENGKTYKSVYGRMSWDEPSPTITTQFYNYGTGRFGHPDQNRPLTLREAALLQTFPSDYDFVEEDGTVSMNSLGIHIGNAVPPILGEVIGLSIVTHVLGAAI